MYYIKLFVKGVDYIKVELICKYCGKTYLEWEERKDRSKYCSKECLKSDKHIDLLEIWYYEKDDTEKILNSIFI